ncbi:MAG: DNA topoisomerase IV subunit B [Bacilli bacterium]
MKKSYSEDSIKVLKGLEAVRKRPGMYIGSTDKRGLHHLVWEVLDNSVDEAMIGNGKEITVIITRDNGIKVIDEGRGVPVGMHSTGVATPELIFATLHAGGKFEEGGYVSSGGLHGVGASVVNALSTKFYVEICRDGYLHTIKFADGGKVVSKLKKHEKTKKTGTSVYFMPDPSIFSEINFDFEIISERLRETAFLVKGLRTTLIDEREDKTETSCYENGLVAFVEFLNEDKTSLHRPQYFSAIDDETRIEVECAFQYTSAFNENIVSFANNIRTREGGTHDIGAKTAFTRSINDYAKSKKVLKNLKSLDGSDIREGLSMCLSVKVPEKYFIMEGQTKSKLGTGEARRFVESVVSTNLAYFLEENPKVAKQIIDRAIDSQKIRDIAKKQRDNKKKNSKSSSLFLSGKLTPCQKRDPKRNELFIVEGDSAGGSAKQGRERTFQAILPLRGKVLNSEKAKFSEIIKNEEINSMIYAIGSNVGRDFELEKCNYDKIIIMTDADTDGAHIQTLLLTFFHRHMRELVEANKVYIALPPLYKVTYGKKSEYLWTDKELRDLVATISCKYVIQRYKGLGEMNADQLWETTMDPKTRTLIQVTIDDDIKANKRVSVLMGDNVKHRREWIESNVDFNQVDSLIGENYE